MLPLKGFQNNKVEIDENIDYGELIKMCMRYFSPETKWDSLFVDTSFTGIMKDCQRISLKIFDRLNKDKAKQVYDFLFKFNYVLGINEEVLSKYKELYSVYNFNSHRILVTVAILFLKN